MKVGPNPDFPVYVQPESTQHDEPGSAYFRGVVRVTLNHVVPVLFVPEARLSCVLGGPYSVTPNDALAATSERIGSSTDNSVVFYVRTDEFARYADELDRIEDEQLGPAPVSRLARYRVAALLRRLATSGQLDRYHAHLLGAR